MKQIYCVVLLLLATIAALSAQNQMDLITAIYGEFNNDQFGAHLQAMDFNGDGYDDLIVVSNAWSETGVYDYTHRPGKIYFYWGGPEFDNIPDFVLEGQWHNHYAGYPNAPGICNAGDMDGDGIDDLALTCSYDTAWGTYKSIALYLGGANPQSEPDYTITYPNTSVTPRALGDINGDGKADMAINGVSYGRYPPFCYIWTDLESDPELFRSSTSTTYSGSIELAGVGDVNNDGYDDCYLTMPINPATSSDQRTVLYYGDASASMSDSLVISDYVWGGTSSSRPLGDINGDGFDDFIGYYDFDYHYIWFGSAELDSIPDLMLSLNANDHNMLLFSRGGMLYAVYGDLNGDGYDDFVCSDGLTNGYNGQAGVWLGGPNVNATVDLVLNPPSDWQWRNFGYSKAMGDFNGDGLCDLALSCPWWGTQDFWDPGRVYVYAGNTQLQDTTVSVDDPVAPSLGQDQWKLKVYPNPCAKNDGSIGIALQGEGYTRSGEYSYKLYNIRGQMIQQGQISSAEMKSTQFKLLFKGLSAGIYRITVLKNGKITESKKVILM